MTVVGPRGQVGMGDGVRDRAGIRPSIPGCAFEGRGVMSERCSLQACAALLQGIVLARK